MPFNRVRQEEQGPEAVHQDQHGGEEAGEHPARLRPAQPSGEEACPEAEQHVRRGAEGEDGTVMDVPAQPAGDQVAVSGVRQDHSVDGRITVSRGRGKRLPDLHVTQAGGRNHRPQQGGGPEHP
ncbi:hypothetical protein Ppa06_51650 [Planomonospora parontospora subsp. parontospora]|uniref:Uncharacterized protein n=2 Tax=Planomonospora parontospora TaxID=58119 RepID=A0AA37F5Z8_9ACTN|nr:hypothetical protein GCM10010126_45040 [Planomonospora parontospora]GII11367.1 hypothetical protein Ppa06_51650 [Planomonospora parontospora subsp. parontospora]